MDTDTPAVETLHAQHGTPNAPTRKQRNDKGKPRETLFIEGAGVRWDLSVPEGRELFDTWLERQIVTGNHAAVRAAWAETMKHLDRLRRIAAEK